MVTSSNAYSCRSTGLRVRVLLAQSTVQQISDIRNFVADLRFAAVELQITELTLAHTMLDSAKVTRDSETLQRIRRKVRKIYQSVVQTLGRLQPTHEQQTRINQLLASVQQRLTQA
jgi:hypothetical protein